MAPFAIADSPATKLIVETPGTALLNGQILMKPSFEGPTAVTLNATALAGSAPPGIPQSPRTGKLRFEPAASDGGPLSPEKPLPRVSAIRHGVTE